jgi:hypothetical protein
MDEAKLTHSESTHVLIRLERMEDKIDSVAQIVIKQAVTEERLLTALTELAAIKTRLSEVEKSQGFIKLIERIFWICMTAGLGILVGKNINT